MLKLMKIYLIFIFVRIAKTVEVEVALSVNVAFKIFLNVQPLKQRQ